jgi:membrane peptidoglycan carboxypeptidase
MVDAIFDRILGRNGHPPPRIRLWLSAVLDAVRALRWGLLVILLVLLGWGIRTEMRESYLQSLVFSILGREMTFAPAPGASREIRFPTGGPYDERLGYAELPSLMRFLGDHHFVVAEQARWSPSLLDFVKEGGYAVYREKPRAGLEILDRRNRPIYRVRYPERYFPNFQSIPPLLVDTLLFIEDQHLLAADAPRRDPAIEWRRFLLALAGRFTRLVGLHIHEGGASTLATQIVKFRHSAGGRTRSAGEKLRQMATAAVDAYRDGPLTMAARQRIVATYLNAEPFGSWPGYGEVIGVPDALWVWYGTSLAEAERVLRRPAAPPEELARKARIYRQVLSLVLAGRRPVYYLQKGRAALAQLTDYYLHLLRVAGLIDRPLEKAALRTRLRFREALPPPPEVSYTENKAVNRLRATLLSELRLPSVYNLDRLDLAAYSTIAARAQRRVTALLARLSEPAYVRSHGFVGKQLLGAASPARVNWSVVLYERGQNANYVRVHADTLDEPFDINSGAKLQLGSTAKLRTLITYLDIVVALHEKLGSLPPQELRKTAAGAQDPLTKWAALYLAQAQDRSLQPMLDAAMQRTYSASPAAFFTGGGVETYANFEKWENFSRPTVLVAFQNSINNAFIRILRDLVRYYVAEGGERTKALLTDRNDPERMVYLRRFARREGQVFLGRFYRDYAHLSPVEMLAKLDRHARPAPLPRAITFRSIYPDALEARFALFLKNSLPHQKLENDRLWDLYRQASVRLFSLQDRGYLAGIHPLALWLVAYLVKHPNASRAQAMAASGMAIDQSYHWLFDTRHPLKQNFRIKMLLDEKAYGEILKDWQKQGYPFRYLIPSYATAIGSSGDRPDALAELMGIILNHGKRLPTLALRRLDFAAGTPYETAMVFDGKPAQQVLLPQVADTVRKALLAVVAGGTGARVRGVYHDADGHLLAVGGKTGTGDNRFDTWGPGARLIAQRIVDRTATFVFFLGNRFFGTITAYVPGRAAGQYQFTSALAVQLLKALEPTFAPLIDAPASAAALQASRETPPPARPKRAAPAIVPVPRSG